MLTKANEWRAAREAASRQRMATDRMLRGIRGTRRIETYEETLCRRRETAICNRSRELALAIDGDSRLKHVPEGDGGRSSRDGPP